MENGQTLSDKLRKAADELEAFRLQLALGKAEASDKFEEVKKEFNKFVSHLKPKLEKAKDFGEQKFNSLRTLLEELQVQLALGKAETKVHFEIQEKKILAALKKLEKLMSAAFESVEIPNEVKAEMNQEILKLKIKLRILKLKYELKKMDVAGKVKEEFHGKAVELGKLAAKFKAGFSGKKEEQSKWNQFNEELKQAYDHLKTAFTNLS